MIQFEDLQSYYNKLTLTDVDNTNKIIPVDDDVNENQVVYSYEPYTLDNTLSYYSYIPNVNMIERSRNPILFLKSYVNDCYVFLQFEDISLNINTLLPLKPLEDNLFIQIEFVYKGTTYDISLNNLTPFIVNNSYIFNNKFTKWFMKSKFDIDVEGEYTIKIIDEAINMLELNEKQYIVFENDSYTIKDA
jgi:hypothetical protein|tara:strand:- start:1163 stop:1732 length:570 start_codon:yes stop_codon:yes gene_type:complete